MRILVYTDGEVIGDGIIRLPLLIAMRKAFPNADITWMTENPTVYTSALSEMAKPLVQNFILSPIGRMGWRECFTPFEVLKNKRFDVIIDFQKVIKKTLRLKQTPHDIFVTASAHFFLSDKKPRNASLLRHQTFLQQMAEIAGLALDCSFNLEPLIYPDAGHWDKLASDLLPVGKKYLGFIVGAGHPKKCWPLPLFIQLAQKWQSRAITPVFFLGPSEQAFKSEIVAAIPDAVFPVPPDGKFSPYLTMALAKRLSAAVANDSGGGHLLATGNVPMVSLFREATVRTKFMPKSSRVIALAPEDFGGSVVMDIPYDAVDQAIAKILNPESV